MNRLTIGTTLSGKDEKITTTICDMRFITENFDNNKPLIIEVINDFIPPCSSQFKFH